MLHPSREFTLDWVSNLTSQCLSLTITRRFTLSLLLWWRFHPIRELSEYILPQITTRPNYVTRPDNYISLPTHQVSFPTDSIQSTVHPVFIALNSVFVSKYTVLLTEDGVVTANPLVVLPVESILSSGTLISISIVGYCSELGDCNS